MHCLNQVRCQGKVVIGEVKSFIFRTNLPSSHYRGVGAGTWSEELLSQSSFSTLVQKQVRALNGPVKPLQPKGQFVAHQVGSSHLLVNLPPNWRLALTLHLV